MLFRSFLFFVLAVLAIGAPPAFAMNILLLHGGAEGTPWTDGVASGVAEEGGAGLHREFLGAATDAEQVHAFAMELRQRLPSPVRVVIATDRKAGAFAGKYREQLFPRAAVVLTGPERTDPDRLALCGDCVALPLAVDLKGTVDLIFVLRPETRLVAGIADGTPAGRAAMAALERAMRPHEEKAELVFPGHEPGDDGGLDLDTFGQVLAGIPTRGVAVLLQFGEDNAGNPVSDGQLFALLEKRVASPVFVFTDAMLGSGVAGGVLVTGRDAGRSAVRLAQRILAGEPAREMLPEPVAARMVFDGSALARFGLTPPAGATVVNAPEIPDGSGQVASGFALMAVAGLAAFAVLLFLLRRYRQSV